MMVSSPLLSFKSNAFPVTEGEDAATNPGIFGKSLAEWLSKRLQERGFEADPPFPEDWGWYVPLSKQDLLLALGCASSPHRTDAWMVYAFTEVGFFRRIRRKGVAELAVRDLIGTVREVLSNEAAVTNIRSEDEG